MKRYLILSVIVLGTLGGLLLAMRTKERKSSSKGEVKAVVADNTKEQKSSSQGQVKSVVAGNSAFAVDFYTRLISDKIVTQSDNLFYSPYSISSALIMTYAGAKGNTESQMAKTMHWDLEQDVIHKSFGILQRRLSDLNNKDACELNIAAGAWYQSDEEFLDKFMTILNLDYNAYFVEADFRNKAELIRKEINEWVESKTNEKIKNLIKPGVLNPLTRLVLVNAVYFKANWALQFDKKNTMDAPFMVTPKEKITTPMMYLKDNFKYSENQDMQVLELPYVGKDLSMFVLLPKETDGLPKLEKALSPENLNNWLSGFQEQEVMVYLPRFTLKSNLSLAKILSGMGMPNAFNPKQADFSGINGKKDLFISNVLHSAFVEVNEQGTEAAAATAVVMKTEMAPPPMPIFRADHPFIFIIKENQSGTILFMGRLVKPQ
jgi:serpin B